MTLLALDTSEASRAAIGIVRPDGTVYETEEVSESGQEHGLLAAVSGALAHCGLEPSALECVACGMGPGSFTGLRVGLSVARTLAWSLGTRILGFSSLELLAASADGVPENALVVPLIDARMSKVFAAAFSGGARVLPDSDIHPSDLAAFLSARPEREIVFAGGGYARYADVLASVPGKSVRALPGACIRGGVICRYALGALDGRLDPSVYAEGLDRVVPEYLRKSEAENQLEARSKSK